MAQSIKGQAGREATPQSGANGQDTEELKRVAHGLADAARAAILPWFRLTDLAVHHKGGEVFDPVTQADKAAESAMRAALARWRPNDGIMGEEFGESASQNGLTWVLDPVDGTRGFICGTPTWGVLIALSRPCGPILGVIDQPYIGERFVGGLGCAYMQGPLGRRPLATRQQSCLEDATLFSTFPEVGTASERQAFEAVAGRVRLVRYGLDCYAYALLAAGHVDLVIEAGLRPYDIHAPIAVIEAAGGIVSDWRGGAAHQGGRVIAAANRDLHRQALDILQQHEAGEEGHSR